MAAALPTLKQGATVPSLYSHTTHSNNKEETDIPQPFKGVKPKQTKNRGRGKGKQQLQKPNPLPKYKYKRDNTLMKILIITTTMRITEVNLEAVDPIEAKLLDDFSEVKILMVEANATKIHIKVNTKVKIIKAITTKVLMVNTITHVEAIIRVIIMANLEAETMVMGELITMDVVLASLIINVITTTNTISFMVMIMTTSLINMAHHVYYVVATITPPNIVLRENTTLTT